MGRLDPPPSVTQRRKTQRRQLVGSSIILTILALILLSYTRPSITLPTILKLMAHPDSVLTSLPDLTHPPLLANLPSSAIPKPGSPGRLIIIGDVHGQLAALDALLAKVEFDASRGDHVVFTGDMVNKGPDSAGVIDRAIEIGAFSVRGNHEDRVLRAWKKMHKKGKKGGKKHVKGVDEEGEVEVEERSSGEGEGEETGPEEGDGEISKSSALDRSTAATLTPAQVTWLAKLPVILRVGSVSPYYGDVIVVHAGLVPGIPLEEQDPWAVMNMRTLISRSHSHSLSTSSPELPPISDSLSPDSLSTLKRPTFKPSEGRKGRPWAKVWNEAQKENAKTEKSGKGHKTHKQTVVYGHDAKVGLSVRRYAFGIDSRCVKGDKLTALVFEPASKSKSTSGLTSAFESGSESGSMSGAVYTDEEEEGVDSSNGGDEAEDLAEMAKHGVAHRLVSVRCKEWSDDDKEGKKKKHKHHKDKGKEGKKHKDQD